MVNRRKRLEKQKVRQADQALVDRLALDLAAKGLPEAAKQQSTPSIHHPLYFCIRSHYDGTDQRWNFYARLAWLKHQLHCMFMSSEMARGLYPMSGRLSHEQLHGMMGNYVRFPATWAGLDRGVTMEEACNVASLEDDSPKRHDLQWITDQENAQYMNRVFGDAQYHPEVVSSIEINRNGVPVSAEVVPSDPLAFGQHFFMPEPVEEESEDLLDILFSDGRGAKLSEIAETLMPESRGVYGVDHFHSSTEPWNIAEHMSRPIPNGTLPRPEDDDK